ncbi:T-cell receptor alpha chain V region CTL-L17 [Pteropus alecto]|nr:T-cell receptor alpha chain V region CTL-L17 [Pteropus alecto]
MDRHPSTLSVQEGNSFFIFCTYSDSASVYFLWYKQEAGKGPQLIIDIRSNKMENQVGRFSVIPRKADKQLSLRIEATQPGDSAVYFCAASPQCFPGTCKLCTNLRVEQRPLL